MYESFHLFTLLLILSHQLQMKYNPLSKEKEKSSEAGDEAITMPLDDVYIPLKTDRTTQKTKIYLLTIIFLVVLFLILYRWLS